MYMKYTEEFHNIYILIRDEVLLFIKRNNNGVESEFIHYYIRNLKENPRNDKDKKYKILNFEERLDGWGFHIKINYYCEILQKVLNELVRRSIITIKEFDKYILTEVGLGLINLEIENKPHIFPLDKMIKINKATVGQKWLYMVKELGGMGNMLWENIDVDVLMDSFASRIMKETMELMMLIRKRRENK